MENIVIIEKQHFELADVIAKIQNFGQSVMIADNGKPIIKISAVAEHSKRQLNFGFMNEEFDIPDDFDRMNEEEIYAMFAGEYGENPFR